MDRLECRRVDERLHERSDLPLRVEGAVELIEIVVATADQRADLAGRNVDVDDRSLQRLPRTTETTAPLLQRGKPCLHGACCRVLGVEVDGGVDLQTAAFHVLDAVVARHLLQHAVDVVRNRRQSAALPERPRRQLRGHRLLVLLAGDLLLIEHQTEHRAPALHGQVRTHERRVVVWATDQARQ